MTPWYARGSLAARGPASAGPTLPVSPLTVISQLKMSGHLTTRTLVAGAILCLVGQDWLAGGNRRLAMLLLGSTVPTLVHHGEWYRLFTANLLHLGVGHASAVLLLLLVAGSYIERLIGTGRMAVVSLLGGSAPARHLDRPAPGRLDLSASRHAAAPRPRHHAADDRHAEPG